MTNEKQEKRNITLNLQAQTFIDSGLSVAELFTIAGLHHSDFEDFVAEELLDDLQEKGFVNVSRFKTTLTVKGVRFIKEISEINRKFKQRVKPIVVDNLATDEFVEKYRKMFKNTRPGAMGCAKTVKSKLTRFFMENPKATQEHVLIATRNYLDSLNSYNYLQQADYFIYKRELRSSEEMSRLSVFVEEIIQNGGSSSANDDWTTKLI